MKLPHYHQIKRLKPSRLISELRKKRYQAAGTLDPGQKMNAAFSLSIQARKFLIAGLKAQGFTESEICETLRKKRR